MECCISFNIHEELITNSIHLDYIWADFFATGHSDDILRIISVLRTDSSHSDIAQGTLIHYGIQYQENHEILDYQSKEITNKYIKNKLIQIVASINNEIDG